MEAAAPETHGRDTAPTRIRRPRTRWAPSAAAAGIAFALLLGGVVFWLAYDGGTFGTASRATAGVVAIWLLASGVIIGALPRERIGGWSGMVIASLAALTAWTWLSILWTPNVEAAVGEGNRLVLYAAVVALVSLSARRDRLDLWLDGLALGIGAVGVLALASRCFPHTFGTAHLLDQIPLGDRRLSYPVGYWNGLAALLGVGLPLSLRAVIHGRSLAIRALAAGLVPAAIATIYLTSSRGGILALIVGILVLFVLAPARAAVLAAMAATAIGSVAAVVVVHARPALVNGPFGGAAAVGEGRSAAAWVAACCIATAAAVAAGARVTGRLRLNVPHAVERALLVGGVVVVAAAVFAANPVRRFELFKAAPATFVPGNYIDVHLISGNGNGRWQLWGTALDEFRAHPLLGGGPNSYGPYQTQHGALHVFVRDAHSLYLQTLAELGLLGFAGVVLLLVAAIGAAAAALRRAAGPRQRTGAAAAAASFAVFAVSCAFDWTWQLPAVALAGLVPLAVLARLAAPEHARGPAPRRPLRAAVVAGLLAIPLLWMSGATLLGQLHLDASQKAASAGDFSAARSAAASAHTMMPWAASPDLQLALVDEEAGQLRDAARWAGNATARAPNDWTIWLVRARIATKRGDAPTAVSSLRRIRVLNPAVGLPSGPSS